MAFQFTANFYADLDNDSDGVQTTKWKLLIEKGKNSQAWKAILSFFFTLLWVEVGYKPDIIHGVESNITLDMFRWKRQ